VLDLEEATHPLDPGLVLALYRCAQEALTNIRKYACATKVLLRLSTSRREEGHVGLTVLDNGQGSEPSRDLTRQATACGACVSASQTFMERCELVLSLDTAGAWKRSSRSRFEDKRRGVSQEEAKPGRRSSDDRAYPRADCG
jgi:hypothetical protein